MCDKLVLLSIVMYCSILTGVRLTYNGDAIENHSFLDFPDVNNNDQVLLCVSDNPDCCTEDNANWFRPGSTTPLPTSSSPSPYSVTRSTTDPRHVRLRRGSGGFDPNDDDGLYRCEIIDTEGNTQMLYVWLDVDTQGK